MKKYILGSFICSILYILACQPQTSEISLDQKLEEAIKLQSVTGKIEAYVLPESNDYANLPNQDPKNPVTAEKAALGKLLFFETGLAQAPKKQVSLGTYSCSTCHVPEKSFTAGRFQGIADGAVGFGQFGEARYKNIAYDGSEVDAQGARPLPTINLTYVRNALWSGAFGAHGMNIGTEAAWGIADSLTSINNKGFEGLESNNTRALFVHRQVVTPELMAQLGLKPFFDAAFGDIPESERYTPQIASNAIAAYFRTVLTNQAPFQKWLKGDKTAMTDKEKRGAELFFGKAGCINCHNSPSFNNQRFAAIGVYDLFQIGGGRSVFRTGPTDLRVKGRGGFTLRDEDLYKFKVPQLYNLKEVGFYFHGGSKSSIKEVIEYFDKAIPENPLVPFDRIDGFFNPRHMTELEKDDLLAFIEDGLHDDHLIRYKPTSIMSGNCFPNNDQQSKIDMGCK